MTEATLTSLIPLPPSRRALWMSFPAAQQPDWGDPWLVDEVMTDLAELPPLVTAAEVDALRARLAEVARGERLVLQAGDCAEDPADCVPERLEPKAGLINRLAEVMAGETGLPALRAGRIAGQFAKPRSKPFELRDGVKLPAFRGLIVNDPEPSPAARRPDPLRLISGYQAAARAADHLRGRVWTSHEALLMAYELPLARRAGDGRLILTSTHWPWIGERTRSLAGAQVALMAGVANPVACKVGAAIRTEQLLALCRRLDPGREPGRLTLIVRMGPAAAAERLPRLVAAVRRAGHPVIWLSDPLHANSITTAQGRKTRLVSTAVAEVRAFVPAVTGAGGVAGGLHLEATPEPVMECVSAETDRVGPYTSLCDPRLNTEQALEIVHVFAEEVRHGHPANLALSYA